MATSRLEPEGSEDLRFHAERLSVLGALVRGVAHEIGNSLHAVTAISDQVMGALAEEPEGSEARENLARLQQIHDQVGRIEQVLREIREFAEPASGAMEPTSVNAAIDAAVKLIRFDLHSRRFRVEIRLERTLPTVRGIARQLTQLGVNLLVRLADACAPGTRTLAVETRRDATWAVLRFAAGEPEAVPPLPAHGPRGAESRGRGFEVAVAEAIVERHGGRLTSDPGHWVEVRLPIPAEAAAR